VVDAVVKQHVERSIGDFLVDSRQRCGAEDGAGAFMPSAPEHLGVDAHGERVPLDR